MQAHAALDVVGQAIKKVPMKKFIAHYEASLAGTAAGKKLAKLKAQDAVGGAPATKSAKKKVAKKKTAPKRKVKARR